jgi:tRNA nucleotidyltransferase/poly(A) polymerase
MADLRTHPFVILVREIAQARKVALILVGGAVRDALLDKPVHDLDFAVQGNAVGLARVVADRVGGAFYLMDEERGTARVIVGQSAQSAHPFHLDFAVCRGANWNEDLFGRDFSINAIALELISGAVLDPTGGQADLPRRVIRQVNRNSVSDDPVRALRALRLELALGGSIEPETEAALRAAATQLNIPSPERIRDEVMKILALPHAACAVRRMDGLGLLSQIVPELEPMRDCGQSLPHRFPALEHTFVVLDYLDDIVASLRHMGRPDTMEVPGWLRELRIAPAHATALEQQLFSVTANDRLRVAVFKLAALLHDIAKPDKRSVGADGRVHFYEHEEAGSGMAAARAHALRLSSDEVEQVRVMVRHHMRPNQMTRDISAMPTARAVYRYMAIAGQCAPELALFCVADGMGKGGPATLLADAQRRAAIAAMLIARYYDQFSPVVAPQPLLSGRDVIALGVAPGPQIGRILSEVREAQMVGEIITRRDALQLAQSLVKNNN